MPRTDAQVAEVVKESQAIGKACEQKSARLLPYVGTPNAARDMDVIRAVVGDTKLHYLGKSYGTYLGAVYAGLFPQNTGRLVLDGAIDPTLTAKQMNIAQAQGFEKLHPRIRRRLRHPIRLPPRHRRRDSSRQADDLPAVPPGPPGPHPRRQPHGRLRPGD